MSLNVRKAQAQLTRMPMADLRQRYLEVHGEPTRSGNRAYLVRRVLWRMQALEQGGLPERARRRALEIANDADLRIRPPRPTRRAPAASGHTSTLPGAADSRLPMAGSVLVREYKGRRIEVHVLEEGFEHEGVVHRSLTSVARAVTGSHWNGFHFFGLGAMAGEGRS